MGSLNGDVMVMRNGRSTSQVSIYNYPEHLNPFYEDDQHKRLRFWKINKKDNEGRRNSFSIGNLKDMWAFKSFRMKKKSSTLGINKTSESPPTLRRDYAGDNGWNTFDHRLRDNNATSLNNDSFQRNATYRSSLQTLPTVNDRIGLNRNDGYRSTIQVTRSNQRYQQQQQKRPQSTEVSHNRRYVYGGSVTPQPLRNTNIGRGPYENDYNIVVRRSSQSSMVSTNPFESDDDENENEDINLSGIRSVNGGSTTTLTSRTPRKKRRAPAPPTPIHNRNNAPPPPIIRIESSHDTTNDELRIEEDIDIANLTAEIQSFVETTNNDNVEITQKSDHKENVTKTTASPAIITSNGEKCEVTEEQKSNVKASESTLEVQQKHEMVTVIEENTSNKNKSKDLISNSIEDKENKAEKITTKVESVTTTETKTTPSKISNDVNKPLEKAIESNTDKVSIEIVTKTDESKEIKSNGAIPKKPNNAAADANSSADEQQRQQQQTITVVDELCIKESNNESVSPKPIPLKRQTKPEPEVGHVECIHIHVESPRATPRKDHTSGISSFKTNESHEASESITTKTPFVLTSPPSQKRMIQSPAENYPATKETVKILKSPNNNERVSELNINEERINAKPEILVKPTLSPKPILKGANGKMHGFAEIHKPIRSKYSNNQNGHVRRASREDSVSPPLVPLDGAKEKEENKINNSTSEKSAIETKVQLTIIENSNAVANKPLDGNDAKQHKEIGSETTIKSAKEFLKLDDELDLLYRPKPITQMEWKRSTLAPLETNIPPEKRKSVKDIIESINRSQRLLNAAANKDFTTLNATTTGVITTETETVKSGTNHKESCNEVVATKRIQNDIEESNGAAAVSPSPSPSPSNYNNELADAQKLDNNEIFQKCKVKKEVYDYRESSPISSNLDWNPVPKPKRTKPGQD